MMDGMWKKKGYSLADLDRDDLDEFRDKLGEQGAGTHDVVGDRD